jgi:hypothetical protein
MAAERAQASNGHICPVTVHLCPVCHPAQRRNGQGGMHERRQPTRTQARTDRRRGPRATPGLPAPEEPVPAAAGLFRGPCGRHPRGGAARAGRTRHEGAPARGAGALPCRRRARRRGDADGAHRPRHRRRGTRRRTPLIRRPRRRSGARHRLRTRHARLPARRRRAQLHGSRARPAAGHAGRLRGTAEADPGLRRAACARPRRRAAGRRQPLPPLCDDARAADALRQAALRLRPRHAADRGFLRDDPHRARARPGRIRRRGALLHGDQHQLATPARHPDGAGHHRLRPRRPGVGHHARSASPGRWRR